MKPRAGKKERRCTDVKELVKLVEMYHYLPTLPSPRSRQPSGRKMWDERTI